MSKKKNKLENTKSKPNEEISSVNAILESDKNDIEEATEKAMQNIDSVVYSDNLVEADNTKTKSVRDLNIEEKNEETQEEEIVSNETKLSKEENNDVENKNNEDPKKYVMVSNDKKINKKNIIIIISIISCVFWIPGFFRISAKRIE